MKRAYISGITNDAFVAGVLVMFRSLQKYSRIKDIEFLCLVTETVSKKSREKLINIGVSTIDVESIRNQDDDRWSTTFTKIKIFDLTGYEKLVWIDADMMVCRCLDELFNHPHMSCVRSRKAYDADNTAELRYPFNSGLMVIVPNHNEYIEICSMIECVVQEYRKERLPVGDQNVLNAYYSDWYDNSERRLEDGYNVFWGSVEDYLNRGYSIFSDSGIPIYVLHYTGTHKPWNRTKWFWIKSYIRSIRYQHRFPKAETCAAIRAYNDYLVALGKQYG